jgi:hypothetical protein
MGKMRVRVMCAGLATATALWAPQSSAAAVTIGATDADFAASSGSLACPFAENCAIWQHTYAPGRTGVIPFDGVVVRWRIRPSGLIGAVDATTSLRLITPGISPMPWGAEGPPLDVPNMSELPATISGNVRLPIDSGQGIAPQFQNLGGGNVGIANRAGTGGSLNVINPAPPPGGAQDGNFPSGDTTLAVAADVETDADGDEFGDETQDGCPTDATTQGACPPADPGDVTAPELRWCGKRKQALLDAGAVRACVLSSELSTIEAAAVLTIAKRGTRAKPIALPATTGGAAAGARAFLDLKLKRKALRRVDAALDDEKKVTGEVVVTATDAAGNSSEVTGALRAKD